jgi:hypothetical protein
MIYRCRFVKPKASEWFRVEADSPEEAANTFHFDRGGGLSYRHELEDGKVEYVYFALVETEGFEPVVSRIFWQGIRRVGRFGHGPTLEDIAKALDYTHHPSTLMDDWEYEENEWKPSNAEAGKVRIDDAAYEAYVT